MRSTVSKSSRSREACGESPSSTRPKARRGAMLAGAGVAALLAALPIACSSSGGGSPPSGTPRPGSTADQVGSVGVKLTLPGGEAINSIQWVITGPNGASTVVQQGSVAVQNSLAISF